MTDWLEILRCPCTFEPLRVPEEEILPKLPLPPCALILCNASNSFAYPVIDGIPMLMKENAIPLSDLNTGITKEDEDKRMVQKFYNLTGWQTNTEGEYTDAAIYEDLRPVSAEYTLRCHRRVMEHLPSNGKFLLDAASGAIQFNELLSYSENFTFRVCVDFSLTALQEARKKLGSKGIYVLCDITNLPFRDGFADAFISLNTIYHIPETQQVKAVWELHRTLQNSGRGVLVYDWFKHSLWMNIALLPFRAFVFLRNKISGTKGAGGRLYFFAHTLSYFRKHLPEFKLFVWRSVSVPFLRYYIHTSLFGKAILRRIYRYEDKNPERCGTLGEYPMLVFKKGN